MKCVSSMNDLCVRSLLPFFELFLYSSLRCPKMILSSRLIELITVGRNESDQRHLQIRRNKCTEAKPPLFGFTCRTQMKLSICSLLFTFCQSWAKSQRLKVLIHLIFPMYTSFNIDHNLQLCPLVRSGRMWKNSLQSLDVIQHSLHVKSSFRELELVKSHHEADALTFVECLTMCTSLMLVVKLAWLSKTFERSQLQILMNCQTLSLKAH